jgi:hypothetical protein
VSGLLKDGGKIELRKKDRVCELGKLGEGGRGQRGRPRGKPGWRGKGGTTKKGW